MPPFFPSSALFACPVIIVGEFSRKSGLHITCLTTFTEKKYCMAGEMFSVCSFFHLYKLFFHHIHHCLKCSYKTLHSSRKPALKCVLFTEVVFAYRNIRLLNKEDYGEWSYTKSQAVAMCPLLTDVSLLF